MSFNILICLFWGKCFNNFFVPTLGLKMLIVPKKCWILTVPNKIIWIIDIQWFLFWCITRRYRTRVHVAVTILKETCLFSIFLKAGTRTRTGNIPSVKKLNNVQEVHTAQARNKLQEMNSWTLSRHWTKRKKWTKSMSTLNKMQKMNRVQALNKVQVNAVIEQS